MLIVIEGPDRCGKSTLAAQLRELSDAEVRHSSVPKAHPLQEYVLSLEGLGVFDRLVLDRWHVGQRVYPQLYPEGREPLSLPEFYWIDLFLRSRGAFLVHMTDDPRRIRVRVEQDTESYLRPDDVERCHSLFLESIQWSVLPFITLRNPLTASEALGLLEVAQVYAAEQALAASWPFVIGNLSEPRYLLVGDELGRPNPPDATHAVPFAPYPAASGRFLMRALTLWPWEERASVAITNSLLPNGRDLSLRQLWIELGSPRVVALGRNAERRCKAYGLPHGSVPHPQYVRRFHHSRLREYSMMIRAAAWSSEPFDIHMAEPGEEL